MCSLELFQSSEADIIANKKAGVVYVADFPQGGKYMSVVVDSDEIIPDLYFQISPRVQLRITYLTNSERIKGVEISKATNQKVEKINFSTLDFERILQLLSLFTELDLKSISNKAIVLNESIIGNADELMRFLKLIVADPDGKQKMSEVANNYGLIKPGDIDDIVQKREAVNLFEWLLTDSHNFISYKLEIGAGKDEEVWQRFFSKNSWILGSDFVEILDERRLDVDNITDYLTKSFDGFVDIIELKLPSAPFWTTEIIPKSELTKATMQCNRYILQTERKIDSIEFNEKLNNTPIVKPRITLIYGRSKGWVDEQREAYRVLNSSYSNLNIITYDHLLERAKRLIGPSCVKKEVALVDDDIIKIEDIPF